MPQMFFGDTDANGQGRLLYRNNIDAMSLFTDNSEKIRIEA